MCVESMYHSDTQSQHQTKEKSLSFLVDTERPTFSETLGTWITKAVSQEDSSFFLCSAWNILLIPLDIHRHITQFTYPLSA